MESDDELTMPDPVAPDTPSSFAEELTEFYRLVEPSKMSQALEISVDYSTEAEQAELRRFLEERYEKPGFFANMKYNFFSRYFDPLRALYNPHVVPPEPRAAPLDTVRRCMALLPKRQMEKEFRMKLEKKLFALDSGARDAVKQEGGSIPAVPYGRGRDILDHLAHQFNVGPTSFLRRCFAKRARVRVVIRRQDGLRGIARGTVLAFDQHWNLLLADVDEEVELHRPLAPGEKIGGEEKAEDDDELVPADDDNLPEGWMKRESKTHKRIYYYHIPTKKSSWYPPKVPKSQKKKKVTSLSAPVKEKTVPSMPDYHPSVVRKETRRRHMRQLVLRGDNVQLVSLDREASGAAGAGAP